MKVFSIRLDEEVVKQIDRAARLDERRIFKQHGYALKITRTGMIRFLIRKGLISMGRTLQSTRTI